MIWSWPRPDSCWEGMALCGPWWQRDRRCGDVIIQAVTGHQSCLVSDWCRLCHVTICLIPSVNTTDLIERPTWILLQANRPAECRVCLASAPYFLIIPPGWQAAVYSSATTGQALSTSHLLVQICTCNYHLFAPLNSPPPSTGFTGENPQDCKLKVKQRRW